MSTQITLTLPDETYDRAVHLAHLTKRNVADVLAEALDISLQPFGTDLAYDKVVTEVSDAELLAVADSQMELEQDRRFSELLDKQQAGTLLEYERAELHALMQVYQVGLLRKAYALNEAVQRGLRKPLEP